MEDNPTIAIVFIGLIVVSIVVAVILGKLQEKFVLYIRENHPIINNLTNIHKKYDEQMKIINREIILPEFWVRSKQQFDRHRPRYTISQIEKFHNHFQKVIKVSDYNSKLLHYYENELIKAVDVHHETCEYDTIKYSQKRQEKYLNSYIQKHNKPAGKYLNTQNFNSKGTIKYPLRYTSPKGQNSYKQLMTTSSASIAKMYEEHIVIPRERERIREKRKQNRLYHNKIYFFSDRHLPGMICIGQTTRENVHDRIRQEYKLMPKVPYELLHWEFAQFNNSKKWFSDHSFHRFLEKKGYYHETNKSGTKTEWFRIDIETAKELLTTFKNSR